MKSDKVVVVLGTEDSGAPLAMELLAANGMCVPGAPKQRPGASGRTFEDATIAEIQDEILAKLDVLPHGPQETEPLDAGRIFLELDRLKAHVAEQLDACATAWGFRDSGPSMLLPVWHLVFQGLGVEPRYVLCVRDPGCAVLPTDAHMHGREKQAELAWLGNTCDALVHMGNTIFLLQQEHWSAGEDGAMRLARELLAFAGLPADHVGAAVNDVIRRSPGTRAAGYAPANPLVSSVYDALRGVRSGSPVPGALLEVTRKARDTSRFYLAAEAGKDHLKRTASEERLKQLEAKASRLRERLEQMEQDNRQLRQEGARLSRLVPELQEHERKLQEELRQHLARAEADKSAAESQLQEQQAKLQEQQARSAQLEAQLRAEKEAAAGNKAAAEARAAELAALASEHEALQAERQRMLADLQQQELQNNSYLREIKALHDRQQELSVRAHASAANLPRTQSDALARSRPEEARPAGSHEAESSAKPLGASAPLQRVPAPASPRQPPMPQRKSAASRRARLWRKLRQDPHQYFADSRIAALRALRHLFRPVAL